MNLAVALTGASGAFKWVLGASSAVSHVSTQHDLGGPTKGSMAVLSCYMDESVDGESKIAYSIGAVIGTKEKWDWLERQWCTVLKREGVAYFSNKDCTGGVGPFSRIPEIGKRLAIREELFELCKVSRVTALGITIDLADYQSVVDTPAKKQAFGGTPHYHAATLAMIRCAQLIKENRPGDVLAIGFDEDEAYGADLLRVFKELKERNPEIAPCLATIAAFDDKTTISIQAADLFAAVIRRFGVSATPPPELAPLLGKGVLAEVRVCGKPCLEDHLKSVGLL